ncbi:MAG TPA: hypothetical protein VMW50_00530 [Dehalococcoidia bacterium]|nr:hypothetical protein [Dehalococcoidia bacterium]
MAGFLLPLFGAGWQAFDNQGLPLAGGLLHTYQAGTVNTPLATYTDSGLGTPNPNPIVLDSTGRPPNEIWIADNPLKLVLTDKNGGAISNGTWDNVPGLNNVAVTVTEWVPSMLTPTYISTTQFSVPGNQTSIFPVNRRLQYFLAGVAYYGYVSVASYDGFSTTTITIVPDATNLDNTLNAVSYGFLNSVNPSVPEQLLTAVASQTHVAGAKATLASLDEFPLADSASSFVIKKVTWAQILANIWTGFGALIAGGTAKTTPTGADTLPISDSAASGASTSLSFTNLLTYLTSALTPTNAINATNATNATNAVNLTGSGTVSNTTTGGAGLYPNNAINANTAATVTTTVASGAVGTTQAIGTNNTTMATCAYADTHVPKDANAIYPVGMIATMRLKGNVAYAHLGTCSGSDLAYMFSTIGNISYDIPPGTWRNLTDAGGGTINGNTPDWSDYGLFQRIS